MRLPIAMLLAVSASCLISDDDGDGTNYVPVNEIEQAYKDAQCEHLALCGVFPTRETCLAAELGSVGQFDVDPNVVAAIYGGHIVYNGSAVKACIDSIAARSCDTTEQSARTVSPECSSFFRGTLMAGEGCYIDEECISQRCSGESGGTCSQGNCIGDTAPVVVPAQIGDSCSSFAGCVTGAYCDQLTNLCTTLKGSGVSCTLASECAYGLGCKGTTGARTCAALPAIGQACAVDGMCRDEGTYCDVTADMCKQLGLPNAQCTSSSQCSQYYPCDFTTSPGVCKQGAGLGQMCTGGSNCFDAGTFCDFNGGGLCTAVKADGSPCSNSQECASGSCDFNTQLCASPMTCF